MGCSSSRYSATGSPRSPGSPTAASSSSSDCRGCCDRQTGDVLADEREAELARVNRIASWSATGTITLPICAICGTPAPFERSTVGFETWPRKDHLERGNDEDGEHDDAVRLRVEGREENNAGLESDREKRGGEGKGNRVPADQLVTGRALRRQPSGVGNEQRAGRPHEVIAVLRADTPRLLYREGSVSDRHDQATEPEQHPH